MYDFEFSYTSPQVSVLPEYDLLVEQNLMLFSSLETGGKESDSNIQ